MKFWVNGNIVGTKETVPMTILSYTFLGNDLNISSDSYDGWIDDVIYSSLAFNGDKLN